MSAVYFVSFECFAHSIYPPIYHLCTASFSGSGQKTHKLHIRRCFCVVLHYIWKAFCCLLTCLLSPTCRNCCHAGVAIRNSWGCTALNIKYFEEATADRIIEEDKTREKETETDRIGRERGAGHSCGKLVNIIKPRAETVRIN